MYMRMILLSSQEQCLKLKDEIQTYGLKINESKAKMMCAMLTKADFSKTLL